jgi:hypothetical protein
MPTEVKDKFSTSARATISLDYLIGNAAYLGQQSDIIDNGTTRYQKVLVYAKFTQSGTVTGSKAATVYGLRYDNANHTSDGAGQSDASITFLNAPTLGIVGNKSSPAAGEAVYGEFIFDTPGPKFGFGVSHDMCQALSPGTGANWIYWVGINPEAQ